MKLLNDVKSENASLNGDTLCDSSLSSSVQSTGQKTFEYSICNRTLLTAGVAGIAPLPVIATDTVSEQHDSESAFTAIISNIPGRKMTLASSFDMTVIQVQRLPLSRSASDSKLCIGNGSHPGLKFADIQPFEARCKGIDELSRVTADIAAENPDIIRFQQVLNTWVCLHFCINSIITS